VELLPFRNPLFEALVLARWYAREHMLLCLVPAFFIAGSALSLSNMLVIKSVIGTRKALSVPAL
jgi:hypothetical protein